MAGYPGPIGRCSRNHSAKNSTQVTSTIREYGIISEMIVPRPELLTYLWATMTMNGRYTISGVTAFMGEVADAVGREQSLRRACLPEVAGAPINRPSHCGRLSRAAGPPQPMWPRWVEAAVEP